MKKVNRPTVKSAGRGKFKINWRNIKGETGYQVGKFIKKNGCYQLIKVVKTVKSKNGESAVIKVNGSKTYYYCVRAYKTEQVNGKGKRIYGPWSNPKYWPRT